MDHDKGIQKPYRLEVGQTNEMQANDVEKQIPYRCHIRISSTRAKLTSVWYQYLPRILCSAPWSPDRLLGNRARIISSRCLDFRANLVRRAVCYSRLYNSTNTTSNHSSTNEPRNKCQSGFKIAFNDTTAKKCRSPDLTKNGGRPSSRASQLQY